MYATTVEANIQQIYMDRGHMEYEEHCFQKSFAVFFEFEKTEIENIGPLYILYIYYRPIL